MNKNNIVPVGDRYLIEVYKSATSTASGLEISNDSNTSGAPVLGTVIKCGDEATKFKEGDIIFYRRYSLDELKFITEDGEQVVSMVEGSEILAKVNQ